MLEKKKKKKREGPQNRERKRTNPGTIVTAFRAAENLVVKMAGGGRCALGNINKSVNGVSGLMMAVTRLPGGPGWWRHPTFYRRISPFPQRPNRFQLRCSPDSPLADANEKYYIFLLVADVLLKSSNCRNTS